MMSKLTIIIPVYNEAENISVLITEIEKKLQHPHQIFIIYDNENDNTIPIVKELQVEYGNSLSLIKNNFGEGALNAIKTGIELVDTDYCLVMMADLSDSIETINKMLEMASKQEPDIICASRYMKEGKQIGAPFLKRILSMFAGLSLFYFAGVSTHDSTNNFKMYKKSFLDDIVIESSSGFELALELVVKAHCQNRLICEVPTVWRSRILGHSRFKLLKWLPAYLKWYIKAFGCR